MAHENQMKSTPNYGNPMESGAVKGDSDEVWEYSSPSTIPINTLSNSTGTSGSVLAQEERIGLEL